MPERRRVPPLERMLHLKRNPMLAGLPNSEVALLAEAARERSLPKGVPALRQGEPVGSVLFVVRGGLASYKRGRRLARFRPGDSVGGLELLARDALRSEVVAEEETLALELEKDAVLEVLEDRFPILHHVLRDMSRTTIELLTHHRLDPTAGMPERRLESADGGQQFDLVDRIFFMRRLTVLRRSSITALAELARQMAQVSFEPGTALWQPGEPAPGVFLIGTGFVRATATNGVRFRPGPGFALGALEALGRVPRWYEAVTETRVVALQSQVDALVDVFEDNFEMAMDYLAVVAHATLRMLGWSALRRGRVPAA